MTVRLARACSLSESQAETLAGRCAAVLESSAPDSVIASVTAARLHELWLPEMDERIHVATARPGCPGRAMTRTRRPQFVAHRFQLRPEDVTVVDGLPVTSLARTWRDLADVLSLADLVAAADCALRAGATVDELAEAIARGSRRRRTRVARAALGLADARSRSRPESHLRVAISAPGLPRFGVNEPVHRDEGGWLAEPDLSLPEAKLALEYQGDDHAKVGRMRKDLSRFADLRINGWLVLPYGPAEVFGRPWTVLAEVRNEIRTRAPHLLTPTRRSSSGHLGLRVVS